MSNNEKVWILLPNHFPALSEARKGDPRKVKEMFGDFAKRLDRGLTEFELKILQEVLIRLSEGDNLNRVFMPKPSNLRGAIKGPKPGSKFERNYRWYMQVKQKMEEGMNKTRAINEVAMSSLNPKRNEPYSKYTVARAFDIINNAM